jgi:hypothetical protein
LKEKGPLLRQIACIIKTEIQKRHKNPRHPNWYRLFRNDSLEDFYFKGREKLVRNKEKASPNSGA